jgi:serine/threonine protein kinase
VLHRDIKPENIMMRPDGIAKVLDFGLAKLNEATTVDGETALTRHGNLAGTVRYLAPEQVLGKPASAASDLYSVGVVLYELATGVQPFSGPTDGAIFDVILHRMPEPPQRLCPTLDDGVAEIRCVCSRRIRTCGFKPPRTCALPCAVCPEARARAIRRIP